MNEEIRAKFEQAFSDMPMDGIYWSDELGHYTTNNELLLADMDFCNDMFEAFKLGYQMPVKDPKP